MSKKFQRMGAEHALVKKLAASSWWQDLLPVLSTDKDINIQVRGASLNVYYKMNSLLKIELGKTGEISCSMHYKFVPLIKKTVNESSSGKASSAYLPLSLNGASLDLPGKGLVCEVISHDILQAANLALLKDQVSNYVTEEKAYQSKFIAANTKTIVDAELAFNESDVDGVKGSGESTRIDLLHYDVQSGQIVAVELKMLLDPRLYNGEITSQLKNYVNFLGRQAQDIRLAYENAKQAKIELGLLSPNSVLAGVDFNMVKIAPKPLLAVVCYNQALIDKLKDPIINAVQKDALGVFFFGKTGDLSLKQGKNKVFFN